MNKSIYLIILAAFAFASCGNSEKLPSPLKRYYLDTIPYNDQSKFFSCCTVSAKGIELNFFKKFVVSQSKSTYGGSIVRRVYITTDSIIIIFEYDSYPIFEADRMFVYLEGFVKGMNNKDTLTYENGIRLLKSTYNSENKSVINYVKFDGKGYLSLNIIDDRNIFLDQKINFIENLYSEMQIVDLPLPKNKIFGIAIENIEKDECKWCLKNWDLVHLERKEENKQEVVILVSEYEFDECSKLKFAANELVRDYFDEKNIDYISFVNKVGENGDFKRFAQFRTFHNTHDEDSYDEIYNYADCVWIDSALAKRLFDPTACGELKDAINQSQE
ncbi:MAG: hypothetical protein R2830_11765 [Saprospiraceae bacterium]